MSTSNSNQSRTATQERPQSAAKAPWDKGQKAPSELAAVTPEQAAELLDKVIDNQLTASKQLAEAFDRVIDKIRELLPNSLKDEASRFVRRALLSFSRSDKLMACTISSKIKCVLDAAELGLAIDGKLCHAVPYNNKVKYTDTQGRERERWEKQAQCMPDYKGLLVVARRCGQIVDAYADIVCENDHFRHGRSGASNILEHTFDICQERGEVIAAYAVLKLPGGDWRYDLMSIAELNAIQARSKSKDSGPWKTDTNEMRKKTVMRRGLKLYCDDPGVVKAIELVDREYETSDGNWIPASQGRVKASSLNDLLTKKTPGSGNGSGQPNAHAQGHDDGGPTQQDLDGDIDHREQSETDEEVLGDAVDESQAGSQTDGNQSVETVEESGDPGALDGLQDALQDCKKVSEVLALKQQYSNQMLTTRQQELLTEAFKSRQGVLNAARK